MIYIYIYLYFYVYIYIYSRLMQIFKYVVDLSMCDFKSKNWKTCHDRKGLDNIREKGTFFASSEKDPTKKAYWFWTLPVLTWSVEKSQWVLSSASFFSTPTPSRYQSQLGAHTIKSAQATARYMTMQGSPCNKLIRFHRFWWPQITIPMMAVERQNSKSIVRIWTLLQQD